MQFDILCEIFKFFDREQLEKLQIICKKWDQIIREHENSLSLRFFRTIGFDMSTFLVVTGEKSGFRPEPYQFFSLKNCIFETFYWYQVLEEVCIPNLVKTLRDIVAFTRRPLKAIEFIYDARVIDERERASHDRKFFQYFNEIMGKLVTTSKLNLTLSFEMFDEILNNPTTILEIPFLPHEITMSPQNWALDPNIERYILPLEAKKIQRFMNLRHYDNSQYTLTGWYAGENFCEEYFRIFTWCQNPDRLIKHIETVQSAPINTQNIPCDHYVASDNEFAVAGHVLRKSKPADNMLASGVLCIQDSDDDLRQINS